MLTPIPNLELFWYELIASEIINSDNSFADGITLSNVIINNDSLVDTYTLPIKYKKVDGTEGTYTYTLGNSNLIQSKTTSLEYRNLKSQGLTEDWKKDKFIGFLSLSSRVLPEESINYQIHYSL